MTYFLVKIKHDTGTARIRILAVCEAQAKARIMNLENCPSPAIVSVKPIEI